MKMFWISALAAGLCMGWSPAGDETRETETQQDSVYIRKFFDEALTHGESYENLRGLCKNIGHRLSGSPQAEKAVIWGKELLESLPFDTVYLQEIEIPFWERGDVEFAAIKGKQNQPLEITTLGGSIATDGRMEGEVIEVKSVDEVKNMDRAKLEGKIVFYNGPMDPRNVSTFESYGGCANQRFWGAVEAGEKGAIGVMVRSLTLLENDHHPHTGSMTYKDGGAKIPAVALSSASANQLHKALEANGNTKVELEINPRTNPNKNSFNVIGEIKGSVYPDKVIVVGGHLDSWDVGEGAHDDGAGVVHSIEALRILKATDYQPKYTIRVVLFMNEENGNKGGRNYARIAKEANEVHIAALESDRGGFSPRGFSIKGSDEQVEFVANFRSLLEPYGLHFFEAGFPGVDIYPLILEENEVNPNLLMIGLVPDSQRYFDFHHAETDVFENVNKRELELGCASLASMIYLLDRHLLVQSE